MFCNVKTLNFRNAINLLMNFFQISWVGACVCVCVSFFSDRGCSCSYCDWLLDCDWWIRCSQKEDIEYDCLDILDESNPICTQLFDLHNVLLRHQQTRMLEQRGEYGMSELASCMPPMQLPSCE